MTETITCECGWVIRGNSQKHAEANLKIHKKSNLHKTLSKNIQSKKEVEKKK